ncbi:glycosyltransferase family 4 protein [Patescibacteria group bacterium]|nr:glycosyltransferase family 4 protein [Patescibacteria group bacterium]
MHVIFLSKRYWPATGGVERHILFLTEALQRQYPKLRVTIITEQHDRSLPLQETKDNREIYRIPLLPSLEQPELKKSIWTWMRQQKSLLQSADIIHVHDVFFWLLPSLPFVRAKKICTTFHGYEPPGPPTWRQRAWHQLAEVLSDGNICIGGFHQKWYGVEPTITSFGAVKKISQTVATPKEKTGKKKLLFVGRLEEDTGIWEYLIALWHLYELKLSPQFLLNVIGDGPLRFELEHFVQQNKLPVHFLGQQEVTPSIYQDADVALVSGYLSILEALSAGVPVIATCGTQLKADYLRFTPFAHWITTARPGNELLVAIEKQLVQGTALPSEAIHWAEQQTWESLAAKYMQLWSERE